MILLSVKYIIINNFIKVGYLFGIKREVCELNVKCVYAFVFVSFKCDVL